MTELTLYVREYCHLCHEMRDALLAIASDNGFVIRSVDVDADPELERKYGELIPVLTHGERELARYRLDTAALMRYLEDLSR